MRNKIDKSAVDKATKLVKDWYLRYGIHTVQIAGVVGEPIANLTPVNQEPSPWAVQITVIDSGGMHQVLWWDYVTDPYFAWSKGVFLIWLNPETGNHDRIAAVDQYPASQSPNADYQLKLLTDCIERFNREIDEMFYDQTGEPHPVDPDTYEYLKTHMMWDGRVFYAVGDAQYVTPTNYTDVER